MSEHRIFDMAFNKVYPHYVTKVVNKGKTEEELLFLIHWLTGYDKSTISEVNETGITFREFFKKAPKMNRKRNLITGSICGVKVQEVSHPLMKKIRQLDKIVDELSKGKDIEKICRK